MKEIKITRKRLILITLVSFLAGLTLSPLVLISTSYIEEKKLKNEIHMLIEEYKRNEIELELNKKKLDSLERSEIQLLKDIFGDNRK
ncbi:MAG: hypothetical protein ACOXZQ_14085 [Bacteroidales bacterium]|jgi:hypothetical protein